MRDSTPSSVGRGPSDSGQSMPAPGSAPAGPPLQYASDTDTHLLDRLAVVYRYRRIAFTVFVLATAAMMIQGVQNVPVFQARGQLKSRTSARPILA